MGCWFGNCCGGEILVKDILIAIGIYFTANGAMWVWKAIKAFGLGLITAQALGLIGADFDTFIKSYFTILMNVDYGVPFAPYLILMGLPDAVVILSASFAVRLALVAARITFGKL